jgi:hypothetical protein
VTHEFFSVLAFRLSLPRSTMSHFDVYIVALYELFEAMCATS